MAAVFSSYLATSLKLKDIVKTWLSPGNNSLVFSKATKD